MSSWLVNSHFVIALKIYHLKMERVNHQNKLYRISFILNFNIKVLDRLTSLDNVDHMKNALELVS